jgi:hypothetical protein
MENKKLYANFLINRFFSAVRQAEGIIFKERRAGVFVDRDLSNWSTVRKILYKLSMPYLVFQEKSSFIYQISSLFIFFMSFGVLILAQQLAWSPLVNISLFHKVFIGLFLLLSAWSYIEFIRDNRYSILAKTLLSLVLVILCTIQSVSFFTTKNISVIPLDRLIKVNFFVGAGFTPLFILLIYTLISLAWSYIILVRYTEAIQSPLIDHSIRQLLDADIFTDNGNKWKILDLGKDEIIYLHKWAEINLSNNEKRTIPTLVLSALLGYFISTSYFRELILNLFQPESSRNNLQAFIVTLLLPFIAYFLSVFSRTLISLFKNIAAQSLIIETCIVAEYSIIKDTNSKLQLEPLRIRSIAEVVIVFLSSFLHKH